MAECPKCGAKVRKEKLRRHINTVHGEAAKGPAPEPETEDFRPVSTVRFPWRTFMALGVVALVVVAGYWYATLPRGGGTPTPTGGKVAVIVVANFGTIKVSLDTVRAQSTANNFMNLANAYRYDGTQFHRVAANFVIQGGAVSGAANVPWEFTGLLNSKYSIAMARSGDANNASYKDTATSQFFINLKDNTALDQYAYPYVVFGHVIEGQAVVDAIGRVTTNPAGDGAPTTPIAITSIRITG